MHNIAVKKYRRKILTSLLNNKFLLFFIKNIIFISLIYKFDSIYFTILFKI